MTIFESKDKHQEAVPLVARIESAKKQLERMIDSSPSCLMLVDRSGTILRGNAALMRFFGRSDFAEVVGRNVRDVFTSEEPAFFDGLCEFSGGEIVRETRARVPVTGTMRDFRFTTVSPGEIPDSRVMIVNDITDEKRRAVAAAKLNKEEAVRALAGALMHNLNQSLTVIAVQVHMMLAALEKGEADPKAMKEDLSSIGEHVMNISTVLREVESKAQYVTESYPGGLNILDLSHK